MFEPRDKATVNLSTLVEGVDDVATVNLSEATAAIMERHSGNATVPAEELTFNMPAATFKACLVLSFISGKCGNEGMQPGTFSGQLLIGVGP